LPIETGEFACHIVFIVLGMDDAYNLGLTAGFWEAKAGVDTRTCKNCCVDKTV
jgi:hypothetical protein